MTFEIIGVRDGEETRKEFQSRSEAEEKRDDLADLFDEIEVRQVHESDEPTTGPGTRCEECGGELPADAPQEATLCEHHGSWALATSDGGEAKVKSESVADKMEAPPEATQAAVSESVDKTVDTTQNGDGETHAPATAENDPLDQLGEELGTDPLDILPGHMTDTIQGQPAVNKRGYAMIAERYGIAVSAEILSYPWDNPEGRCVAKATAETDDGRTYTGHATANADDGDMQEQIIELAETRALKRAVSWASGVGIVSYQELMNELP